MAGALEGVRVLDCTQIIAGPLAASLLSEMGADVVLGWPTAEIAVMGPEAAVNLLFRRELEAAADPESRRRELVSEYEQQFATPYQAAARGFVDDVILPRQTRPWLIRALRVAREKRVSRPARKHGNIPL